MQAGPKSDNTVGVLYDILVQHGFSARQSQEAAELMTKNDGRGRRFVEILSPPDGGGRVRVDGTPPRMGGPPVGAEVHTHPGSPDDHAVQALLDGMSRIGVGDSDFKKKKAFVREMVEVRFRSLKKVLTGHIGHVSLFIQAGNEIPSLRELMQDLHALRAQVEASELNLLSRFSPVELGPRNRGRTPDEEFERV